MIEPFTLQDDEPLYDYKKGDVLEIDYGAQPKHLDLVLVYINHDTGKSGLGRYIRGDGKYEIAPHGIPRDQIDDHLAGVVVNGRPAL